MADKNLIIVKIIGWIELIVGGFGCLVFTLFIFLAINSRLPGGNPELGLLCIPLMIMSPLAACFILGVGILKLSQAARVANIIVCSIVLAIALPILIILIFAANPDCLKVIPAVVMSVGFLWFLTRSEVRRLFR